MLDTGASQTIVSADVTRNARLLIRPTQTELRNASGTVMTLLGEADAILCNDKHSVTSTVLVATQINHSVSCSIMAGPSKTSCHPSIFSGSGSCRQCVL